MFPLCVIKLYGHSASFSFHKLFHSLSDHFGRGATEERSHPESGNEQHPKIPPPSRHELRS